MKIDKFPGTLTKQNNFRYVLTQEQIDWLCKWYPVTENSVLMKMSGIKFSTLHRFARQFKLTKSDEGLKKILYRTAKRIKKICEKNGYYDSIRGKQPSEACRQASLRRWQDVRDGKLKHPFHVLSKRKYNNLLSRMSVNRKELIRKEQMRTIYGLDRKTRLRIVMCRFRPSQINHRYAAKKRGYILPADISEDGMTRYTIYYNADTTRNSLFEKNLINDGFKVLPL